MASASAQVVSPRIDRAAPDGQFGIGFNNHGAHIQYSFGAALHLGLSLNLDFHREQDLSDSRLHYGPYVKFLTSDDVLRMYALAGLTVLKPYYNRASTDGVVKLVIPQPEVRLPMSIGAEHFFNQHVGVYGHVDLIDAKLEPEPVTTGFGLQGGTAGVEFFF